MGEAKAVCIFRYIPGFIVEHHPCFSFSSHPSLNLHFPAFIPVSPLKSFLEQGKIYISIGQRLVCNCDHTCDHLLLSLCSLHWLLPSLFSCHGYVISHQIPLNNFSHSLSSLPAQPQALVALSSSSSLFLSFQSDNWFSSYLFNCLFGDPFLVSLSNPIHKLWHETKVQFPGTNVLPSRGKFMSCQ